MSRPRIAFLFGGPSEEHDVSVRSAARIAAAVDVRRYEPVYVGITRSGAWRLCPTPGPEWETRACEPAVVSPDRETHGILVRRSGGWQALHLDAVFPVLHGRTGEDGAIQGLLELSGIPYVGCGITGSAVCMDKALAYVVAQSAGIPTPTFEVLDGAAAPASRRTFPVFVKPARSGSSFGVSRVERAEDLDAAIAEARRYDRKVLIEEAVAGTEVGCAVLGSGEDLVVGEIDRVDLHHGFFRIHQEADPECGSDNAVVRVPADLTRRDRERIRAAATRVFAALGCEGLARVDQFLTPDGRIVLNEVNTLPGFTSYSRYPRMMAAAGLDLAAVIDRCITGALAG